jgi:hypothetical protein
MHTMRLFEGRWDRNRTCNLRLLETQSGVSGSVGHHRQMPLCPRSVSSTASECRRVSAATGADTGTASSCAGALLPALLCTDVDAHPQQIITWFILRWQLEVAFHEVRTHLGVETQRQWSSRAILRTAPGLSEPRLTSPPCGARSRVEPWPKFPQLANTATYQPTQSKRDPRRRQPKQHLAPTSL